MAIEAGLDMRHIPNHRQPFRVRCALHDPHKLVICIYSNYELAYIISDAAIAKMQKRLGIQEALVWYVCSLDPGRRGVGLLLGGNYSVRNHALLVPRTVIRRWSVSPIGTDSNGRVYQHARHFLFGLVVDSVSIVVEVVNIYDMATVVVLPCT
ncbi:uncharacterized protein C8Q71DRAFT_769951 [Rhodofomes roseus]|uniref:Uncharacterized protein n=1 Tax=Rhodofomes roseus TaxID=34475 RepID=A0ABQ8KAX2_9APHY|nr:uncharacterized protein C8Q71DRAFT_769951 [Rhodofomes roseus]KAH9834620.1 hypothetical protein C8Q71DRAFT_769951 [Rhodofomes roseus]